MTTEETPFRRPNPLATVSLVLGILTLTGQFLGFCMFYCTPFLLAVPTVLTLATGWFGLRQARQTGVGAEAAIVGLVLGFSSLAMSLFWVGLMFLYALLLTLVAAVGA